MNEIIQNHYSAGGTADLIARFNNALRGAGFASETLRWSDLAPLDQFHVRGLAATKELANGLALSGGETVLDVGCGFGGPARFLAAEYNCRVTGIDLTPAYVAAAQWLSQRTGLTDCLTFVQGDALHLPFAPESFDHAWTQHVAMNIADKEGLYGEIYRVLKPGGRLAIYDVVTGNNEPIHYPVPWARNSDISFLVTSDEMTRALHHAGFQEISTSDPTDEAIAWFAAQSAAPPSDAPPFNLPAVLGQDGRLSTGNLARNLAEGRVRLTQKVAQKG